MIMILKCNPATCWQHYLQSFHKCLHLKGYTHAHPNAVTWSCIMYMYSIAFCPRATNNKTRADLNLLSTSKSLNLVKSRTWGEVTDVVTIWAEKIIYLSDFDHIYPTTNSGNSSHFWRLPWVHPALREIHHMTLVQFTQTCPAQGEQNPNKHGSEAATPQTNMTVLSAAIIMQWVRLVVSLGWLEV